MSRIGKQPINIPEKTEVSVANGLVLVKGPLGELSMVVRPDIDIKVENNQVITSIAKDSGFAQALWGTYASKIGNMVDGVNKPFEKKMIVEGIGFKSAVQGSNLVMSLGFSHEVVIEIPKGLEVTAEKNVIKVSGIDKEKVGKFAAEVRSRKKPEPYKGKGIRYEKEVVRRKQGKKTA